MYYRFWLMAALLMLIGCGSSADKKSDKVEEPTVCTTQYAPVCGAQRVECIQAPCPAVLQTYANRCVLDQDQRATFLYEGECLESNCTRWFDGCNDCFFDAQGNSVCTEKHCDTYDTPKCLDETEEPVACTMQYDPVCGLNGAGEHETYSNSCFLGLDKNASYLYQGECTKAL
ncbi:MAG: hypothetical protein JXK05_07630 [Campylobacterales bacterium]|nr:hypothetical protein [Campylobacterales bacterium]